MDQQNFEATRPASADPAVALTEMLGQLPKSDLDILMDALAPLARLASGEPAASAATTDEA